MSGWRLVRLDQCTEIVSGATPDTSESAYWGGDICWATPKDLSELEGPYISDTPRKLTRRGLASCAAAILPSESVLFSSRAPIGHVAINTVPMATNQGFKSFVPDRAQVHAKYLYHWLRKNRSYIEGLGNGATFKEVSKAVVSMIQIPLPPLTEQCRIAALLDKVDALRAKRRAGLARLDALKQSIFLDMFGDPRAHRWPMSTVAGIAAKTHDAIRTGPFGSQLLHSEFTDDGIAVLGIDNVVENEFRWAQRRYISDAKYRQLVRYTAKPGDVLITIMGTCGRCAIVPDDIPAAITTKHLCCITLDHVQCLPAFLHAYFLQHPIARRHLTEKARGAIMEGLNMTIIKEMPIPIAPMALQEAFAGRLRVLNRLRKHGEHFELECNSLFGALQHRAFQGEL